MKNKNVVTLLALLVVTSVFAGGFRISLQGVRQAAMAHTSAHTRDASVIFFNPAGMAFIEDKLSLSLGVFGTSINSEYQDASQNYVHETDNPMSTPVYFGAAYKVKDNISVGLSVTTPFGNSLDYGKDWNGNELVQDIELRAFFIQPTVAVKFTDWFSAGLGYIYATGNVELNKAINLVGGDTSLTSTKATGGGFNVGAYFKPTSKLDISLAYRSKVDMKAEGDAKFNVPDVLIGGAKFVTADDTFEATLPLASEFTAGVSYKVLDNLTLAADINVTGWQAYHNLTFDFGQNTVGNDPDDATISTTAKDFKFTNSYRFGAEYVVKEKLALRAGYYYDESPVQMEHFSPETPSTDNHYATAGVGYQVGSKFYIDAFASKLFGEVARFNNTTQNFQGQLKNDGFLFGIGFTYNAF